ncbi:MAG: beta-galactosidase [Bacteroidota bacterium]|nr:beta-galactosidase [Bacteroidota bacterium]
MKKNRLFLAMMGLAATLSAQNSYHIDITKVRTDVMRGHLDLGGRSVNGDTIGVNSFYIERNGKPIIPVIGEFHFSRYPHQYWDEELRKLKAGGISVVATYVFWNMHEPKEGNFNWSGDYDVRSFVELCHKNGLEVLMRIGPFAHGEIRSGGLPDWLYGRPIEVRTNDPAYMFYVNRLYQEIGKQLKGLMFKDGGPVIGVQIENEYQHSAAPWGISYMDAPRERTVGQRDNKITQDGVGINNAGNEFANVGRDHMKTLKQLAIKAGLVTPIYTATGWGRATIIEKGSIPVMAGYAYPFWSKGTDPSPFYTYKDIQKNPDYSPVSYDVNLYPSMAAELGTGMANIYSRRPHVLGESFLPMMVRTVGSGTNGLGFYMFHGGTTPSIGNFFFSEGWGLHNKSYDYQAPIGEFGNVSSGFNSLKMINYFLASYGSDLAPLRTILSAGSDTIKPTNITTLRYAVRGDGEKGFLFMHNFQDHVVTSELKGLKVDIATKSGTVTFPEAGTFTLKAGASAIFPFNLNMDGVELRMATVQPFCRFSNNGKYYNVLASVDGIAPEMVLKGKVKTTGSDIKTSIRNGNTVVAFPTGKVSEIQVNGVSFLVLPWEQALNAYLVGKENQHLVISKSVVLDGEKISLICKNGGNVDVSVYPAVKEISANDYAVKKTDSPASNMTQRTITIPTVEPKLQLAQADDRHFVLKATDMDWSKVNDVFVTFDYRGDRALCMMNGELQTDNLYSSQPWTIGLKRYSDALKTNDMYFYFIGMTKDAPYLSYLDKEVIPDFGNKKEFLEIKKPVISVEYKVEITLK